MSKLSLYKEKLEKPKGVTFFVVISFEKMEVYYSIKQKLESYFSKIMFESNPLPKWTISHNEKLLSKVGSETRILSFKRRIHREELPEIKRACVEIREKHFAKDETIRMIPGYLCSHSVVLASIYDDYHRIYLYHGVFAEIVYKYEKQKLIYIDTAPLFFGQKEIMYFFTNVRDYYMQSLDR